MELRRRLRGIRPPPGPRSRLGVRGAALLEVVMAMTLLAVALVGIQAALLAAIHAGAAAANSKDLASLGGSHLEDAVAELREGRLPGALSCPVGELPVLLERTVSVSEEGRLARVEVRLIARSGAAGGALTLSNHVFSPTGFSGEADAQHCP